MAVVSNFYFSIFLRLTWEFLGFESEREGSVYWSNNKIIDMESLIISERLRLFDHMLMHACSAAES